MKCIVSGVARDQADNVNSSSDLGCCKSEFEGLALSAAACGCVDGSIASPGIPITKQAAPVSSGFRLSTSG